MIVCGLCGYPPYVRLIHADEDVLRLDVSVDDLALAVHVVQALQHLLHHEFYIVERDTLVVASYNVFQKIVTQNLKLKYGLVFGCSSFRLFNRGINL